MADAFDVQPPRRNIGRYQQVNIAVLERFELFLPRRLVDITVDFARPQTGALQRRIEVTHRRFAVAEDDRVGNLFAAD